MAFERAEILFVCAANTGLARIVEGHVRANLTRAGLKDEYRLRSAALPDDPVAQGAIGGNREEAEAGFRLPGQLLSAERINQADLILVMTRADLRAVVGTFVGATGKTTLLSDMAGSAHDISGVDTPSPDAFRRLSQELEPVVGVAFETILSRADKARADMMARVGLSTILYHSEFVTPPLAEVLALFRRAGFKFVDWTHDMSDDRIYSPVEMDQFAELLAANDLECEQLHGMETGQFNPVARGEALDRYVAIQGNRVELCARLGGDTVVIHIPGNFCDVWDRRGLSMAEPMEWSTIALDRLRPLCDRLGVTLAVENSGVVRYDRDCERLDFYLSRYPASFVTFCLDVGHANRHGPGALEGLKGYGDRLSALHLHDNRGVEDDHQPPFFGSIDWAGLLGWLLELDYARSLNFELGYARQFFPGGPPEYVAHAARRIRQALSLVPAVKHRQSG
jgi:sugar phosphate isomerase/epimerase/protein-tyrosine-phosphatase